MSRDSRISFETEQALSLLSWEWQPYEEILRVLMDRIPAGRGLRKYAQRSALSLKKTEKRREATGVAAPSFTRYETEDEQIESGRRDLARTAIQGLKGRRTEEKFEDGVRFIRFLDRRSYEIRHGLPCPTCGVVGGIIEAVATPSEVAKQVSEVTSESKRALELFSEIVVDLNGFRKELDTFTGKAAEFLAVRISELEKLVLSESFQ